jgi:uncharacterized membrane protein
MKVLVAFSAGLGGGIVAALLGAGTATPLVGWDVMATIFCIWTIPTIWRSDAGTTARHAGREDPGRQSSDLVLLGAATASLIAVSIIAFNAGHAMGSVRYWEAAFAVVSVLLSSLLVHIVFTLKYARLYYLAPTGGIDFNELDNPRYSDFAYLSFTIGMTFQVSDTDIESQSIRRVALHHAVLSFPLGAVIVASTVGLVAGLLN